MSWNLILRPEVESDVEDAAEWYESRNPSLGREFREEIISALEEIAENPLIHCRSHACRQARPALATPNLNCWPLLGCVPIHIWLVPPVSPKNPIYYSHKDTENTES